MSRNSNDRLTFLIRQLRELDTQKTTRENIKNFLDFIAHELELILGGFYE